MLARRDARKILEDNWRKVTHMNLHEFRLDRAEDVFTWLTKRRGELLRIPKTNPKLG